MDVQKDGQYLTITRTPSVLTEIYEQLLLFIKKVFTFFKVLYETLRLVWCSKHWNIITCVSSITSWKIYGFNIKDELFTEMCFAIQ